MNSFKLKKYDLELDKKADSNNVYNKTEVQTLIS